MKDYLLLENITVCKQMTLMEIIIWTPLVLDRNTWNQANMCKLFVLDRNTWYHIYVRKKKEKNFSQTTTQKMWI